MSVVVGCSLFSGVMVISDSRATIIWPGKPEIYVDNVQKIIPLTSNTIIGFVGDIVLAGLIIRDAKLQLRRKILNHRADAISIFDWLPRYLKYAYNKFKQKYGERPVAFIVASVIPQYRNVIEYTKIFQLLECCKREKRTRIPGILAKALLAPPGTELLVTAPPHNVMYYMVYPKFEPMGLQPLEYVALGSGEEVKVELGKNAGWIFADQVGNHFMESTALRLVVSSFIKKNNIETVGGMYPCIKIDLNGITLIGESVEIPYGGTRIDLFFDDAGHWVQKNYTTGKEIKLLYPWEIDFNKYTKEYRFDDMKDGFFG